MHILKMVLKFVFAAAFIFAGVTHFSAPGFFLKLMPDYIPTELHAPAVYVSGVFEILLGLMLLVPQTTRLAGWGLIALLIAVFPANIYAYQHQDQIFPGSNPTLQLLRLPLQAVLIAWAYWYTRGDRRKTEMAPPEEVAR